MIRRNDTIPLEIDDAHDQDGTVNFDPRTTQETQRLDIDTAREMALENQY